MVVCSHGLLCLMRSPFGCITCETNQVVLWCGLRLALRLGVANYSCEEFPCRAILALPRLAWGYLIEAIELYEYVFGHCLY